MTLILASNKERRKFFLMVLTCLAVSFLIYCFTASELHIWQRPLK